MSRIDPVKEECWKKKIEEWRQSGLTGAEWCRHSNVKECLFYYWKSRLAPTRQPNIAQFVELAEDGAKGCEIVVLVGGVKVELKEGFSEQALARLIRVLEGVR